MRKGEVSSLTLEQLEPLQTLGSGACGTVRLARHRASGKTIALKIINITDQGQRGQVLNELHVLCALNDEHIVPLHDAFYLDGNVYLALGYCNGGSLDDLLGAYQALASSAAAVAALGLPERVLSCVLLQVLCGLRYLHANSRRPPRPQAGEHSVRHRRRCAAQMRPRNAAQFALTAPRPPSQASA